MIPKKKSIRKITQNRSIAKLTLIFELAYHCLCTKEPGQEINAMRIRTILIKYQILSNRPLHLYVYYLIEVKLMCRHRTMLVIRTLFMRAECCRVLYKRCLGMY